MSNWLAPYSFGYGLYPSQQLIPTANQLSHVLDAFFDDNLSPRIRDFAGKLSVHDNGNFEYKVDASGFRPEELKVDLEGDDIIVEGKHEAKTAHETVVRHFTRRIRIPEHIQKDTLQCDLDKHGHLQITGHGDKSTKPNPKRIPIYRVYEGKSLTQDGEKKNAPQK